MKREKWFIIVTIIVMVIFLGNNHVSGQNSTCDYLMTKVVTDNDMTIESKKVNDEKNYVVHASVPTYYDFDLFKMKFNGLIREYSDITVVSPWTYSPDNEMYYILLDITDKMFEMTVAYTNTKRVIFIYPSE